MEYKYSGIILNKRDIGETDRAYTIYTLEGGKVKSLAKGVRKSHAKLAAALENVALVDITIVKTKGLGNITGAIIENSFANIKGDSDAILEVFSALSLFDKLIDLENPDSSVFELLKSYLETADACAEKKYNEKYVLLRLGFITKLLHELGYSIEAGACVICRKQLSENSPVFSARHGGTVCNNCAGKDPEISFPIRVNAVKLLRLFLRNKINALAKIQANREDINSAHLAIDEFLRWNS